MCKVIAITNQKGGIGKTTTVHSLGTGLVAQGKKVLLIDLDPQANLTMCCGLQEPDKLDYTVLDVIDAVVNDEPVNEKVIVHTNFGVDLIPSNIGLSGAEISIAGVMSREVIVRSFIEEIRGSYDYILIDTMPSLGILTVNALACADSVLIPVQPAYLPAKGLQQLLRTVSMVRKRLNPSLKIEGILFTLVDSRTRNARDIMDQITQLYGQKIPIFVSRIPVSVRASEMPQSSMNIFDYDPEGKVAMAYGAFTKEVMENGSK